MTARKGPSVETASRVRARWRAAAPSQSSEALFAALPAKLRPPQPRVNLIERRALLGALGETKAPLVVLCAPAGAGKTTVLRQWAESDERPFAWVQLDQADSDPVVLLSYLALALEPITDVDPSVKASLSLAVPPIRERILPLLGEALAAAPGFVLVLDDAHLLSGDKPWEVVAFVLRNLPDGAQLALGSRSDPELPLARMRAAGDVAEFRAAELSLLRHEVAELMRLHDCEA
ncbi:MAG TPA: AAA family ATPase, partial [Thermoleophilia bacterium]